MLERLTERTSDGIAYTKIPLIESHLNKRGVIEQCFTGFVADRLAAYEDTGLTPEGIYRLKAKYEALESDKNAIESSHINAEMNLETQQREIEQHIKRNEAHTKARVEQAERIRQMEEALRQTKTVINDLMACNEISNIADARGEEAIKAIEALLGGKEDA